MLEVGKLYVCEEYFLMLYPDPDTAGDESAPTVALSTVAVAADPAAWSAFWSNRFGKTVCYAEKNIPLLVLNNEEKYIEVLAGDKKGWIVYQDWLEIKEIDHA